MDNDFNPLMQILKRCRSAFIFCAMLSCLINMLMLTIPFYTLQVFDRVVVSQSSETLLYLTILSLSALLVLALLEMVRSRVLLRISFWVDQQLNPEMLDRSLEEYVQGNFYVNQSLVDVTTLRQFFSSTGINAFFDAPWVVIFLAVIFILSITLGVLATIGAIAIFLLAWINEKQGKKPNEEANQLYIKNQKFFSDMLKSAESIYAMGMLDTMKTQWMEKNAGVLHIQKQASDHANILLAISKFIRMGLQIAVMGIGAYFVLQGNFTGGAMIAASIIMGRALAPVEQAIAAWKQFDNARIAYYRILSFLRMPRRRVQKLELQKPQGTLQVEHLTFVPEHEKYPVLFNINFTLQAGESLAIIGPSGAGKSTLIRMLFGLWYPTEGVVRLDNVNIYDWSAEKLGQYIGYLPQNAELLSGSVKENIARLQFENDEKVIEAAEFVNVHQMILKLKASYSTPADRYTLSGGQQQRVALARAFYNKPSIVLLDEPEKNLDQDGLVQLRSVIERAKAEKITLVFATHRIELAQLATKTLILQSGQMQQFGLSSDVLKGWLT